MWRAPAIVLTSAVVTLVRSAPDGFPSSGNGLWYKQPATVWASQYLPIGNGYLAAMLPGGTTQETTQLNIESLWSGGPFADPSYNGGNKPASEQVVLAQDMHNYRKAIFESADGTIPSVAALQQDAGAYGSYAGAGYLLSTLNTTGNISGYARWLDLDIAVARTKWTQGNSTFLRESFCSHPSQSCTQHINVTGTDVLPNLTYAWSALSIVGLPTPNITCLNNATLQVRGLVSEPGMLYELLFLAQSVDGSVTCQSQSTTKNATLHVEGVKEAWISWVGGTNYDLNAGDLAHNFTFIGLDPHSHLISLLSNTTTTASPSYQPLLSEHFLDYTSLMSSFSLSLGQDANVGFEHPMDELVTTYEVDKGDPYVEWLTFNLGRYLLAGSARGALPANLQGKWGWDVSNAWGADYHSNINLQMNYWFAEMTGMGSVTASLFDYIEKTWAPRGALTAQTLYNISRGWVTHDEMNIFGHTGMKSGDVNSAQWADYPESAVWMMIHTWDHFDYTNDVAWWQAQGWPLVKGVASFHLDKLILDLHFNDSTLVTAPCNSPEQIPITLGCAHAQQLIWQLFNAVEKGFEASGETDTAFLEEVKAKRDAMDKGIHIGSWGQLQEWKVDMDSPTDTHRHLSHLIGMYPGYALANYDPSLQGGPGLNYTKEEVWNATETSLIHRGNGTGPDADAGWEKAWRAAEWAQFGNKEMFYHELTYTIERNFGTNLFSLYDPEDPAPIFQIDANFGFPAALLNAIIQAPDVATSTTPLTVTLLPALPDAWTSGQIRGARIRGGISLDMAWANGQPTDVLIDIDQGVRSRPVRVVYGGQVVSEFTTTGGMSQRIV